jgi:hypothetical protein
MIMAKPRDHAAPKTIMVPHGIELQENGALLLEKTGDVVLCKFRHEFVTWRLGLDGSTYSGHYFREITDAVEDYQKRIKEG